MSSVTIFDIPGIDAPIGHNKPLTYKDELDVAVLSGVITLREHCSRWRALWLLTHPRHRRRFPQLDNTIAKGTADFDEALACLQAFNAGDGTCPHVGHQTYPCVGIEIRLPMALVLATIICHHHGVPDDVALHQIYCNDAQHSHCF